MQTIRIKNNYLRILLCALILVSCAGKTEHSSYKSIDSHKWFSKNKIAFIVNNTDTISKKNVFIHVRNNKDYEFSSLFLIAKIEFPNGFQVTDTLEYEMTDSEGNWLGSGFTELKENKLFYKENVLFSEKGDYKFNIEHATRSIKDIEGQLPLNGITDVGLSIEKVTE